MMTDTDEDFDADDDFPADTHSDSTSSLLIFGIIGAVAILGLGFLGYASGTGWFGYRSFLYGDGQLYVGNYTTSPKKVSVDGRKPVELKPKTYELIRLVGGTSQIAILDQQGSPVDDFTVTIDASDAFAKIADEPTCLVASDVSPFYGSADKAELEFVEHIEADQTVYVPGSRNVIWPGKDFPKQLEAGEGPGIWLEKVGCAHLEDPKMMRAYLQIRMRERMKSDEPTRHRTPPPQ